MSSEAKSIDLARLADPFEESDIEWRVSRAGNKNGKLFCLCLAYCTARAIQRRLDQVCGPENWRNEPMTLHELRTGPIAIQVGISIRINGEWVTKWDVSEPTHIEPAKGGFSGAMKRAGAQWGIGRYLYQLDETFAEVCEEPPRDARGWIWATLPEKKGGGSFYWKPPKLPGWAMPKEPEHEIKEAELKKLKDAWRKKYAPDSRNPSELLDGFRSFVRSCCGGDFPIEDVSCWLRVTYDKCMNHIQSAKGTDGVSPDVRFDE